MRAEKSRSGGRSGAAKRKKGEQKSPPKHCLDLSCVCRMMRRDNPRAAVRSGNDATRVRRHRGIWKSLRQFPAPSIFGSITVFAIQLSCTCQPRLWLLFVYLDHCAHLQQQGSAMTEPVRAEMGAEKKTFAPTAVHIGWRCSWRLSKNATHLIDTAMHRVPPRPVGKISRIFGNA